MGVNFPENRTSDKETGHLGKLIYVLFTFYI